MNTINGEVCKELICEQFFIDDQLISEITCMYLHTNKDNWYMIFLDDEDYKWKIETTKKRPERNAGFIIDGQKFCYPIEDIGSIFGLQGMQISSFVEKDLGKSAQGKLQFQDSFVLVLDYNYDTEKCTYDYVKS